MVTWTLEKQQKCLERKTLTNVVLFNVSYLSLLRSTQDLKQEGHLRGA